MIILSKGTLENVYAAFVLANGARMEGIEAEMFFTFFVDVLNVFRNVFQIVFCCNNKQK